jgi:hypothetical protein
MGVMETGRKEGGRVAEKLAEGRRCGHAGRWWILSAGRTLEQLGAAMQSSGLLLLLHFSSTAKGFGINGFEGESLGE